jgi:hypothetical protein
MTDRKSKKKVKLSPVAGRERLKGTEMLRIPQCLGNQLLVGGEAEAERPHPESNSQPSDL